MTDKSVRSVLQDDIGVQKMARLYASLNDWYDNIHQARRGVRACERVCRVRDRGLVPLAQRYFEFVADKNNLEFEVTEDEILEKIQELSNYIMENKEDRFWNILSSYRNEKIANKVMIQIEDFSNGNFDKYNAEGERSLIRRTIDKIGRKVRLYNKKLF